MARHSTPGFLLRPSRLAATGVLRLAAAWAVTAWIAAGCSEAPRGRPCDGDPDCSAGSVCREGLCITPAVQAPTLEVDVTSPTRAATVNLSGTATGAVKVRVHDNGSEVGEADVTAGAWSFPLAPAEGTHQLTARAESATGQLSEQSAAVTVVVDRTAPAPPVVTVAAVTNAQPVPISGTTDTAGATVFVREGPTLLGTLTATGTAWGGTVTLVEGDHQLSVTAADPAGNVSTPTVKPVSVDRTPPPAPTLVLGVTSPTKIDPVPVSGTCSADAASVRVLDGAVALGTFAAAAGAWSGTVALAEGTASLRASALDDAGNPSAESTPVALLVDRTAPGAPVVNGAALTNAQPVPLSGTTDTAGAVIEIREGATLLGVAAATGTTWARAVTLAEGDHALSVTAIDAAGNVSAATPKQVTVDRTRPQVVSRSPAPGSAGHDFRQPILISFDEPVLLGVQQGRLTNGLGLDIGVAPVLDDPQTVSLTPSTRVTPDSFTVTVPADLHDAAGNLVQLPAGAWTFTAPAWLPVGPGTPLNVDAAKDAQVTFTYERSELGQPQPGIADGRRRGGLARGAGSELWVAAVDTDAAGAGTAPLVVRRWDGAAWSTLPSNPTADAGEAVLAAQGATPVVGYLEGTSLFVKRWTGTAWATFETPAAPLNASGTPAGIALALDPAGNPVVAWIDTSVGNLLVRGWSGSAWQDAEVVVGNVSNPTLTPNGYAPGAASVATDGTELAVAVVRPDDVNFVELVHVYRRNAVGPSWDLVGGVPLTAFASTNPGTQPCLLLSGGRPAVAWVVNDGCTTCKAVTVVAEFTTAWPAQLLPLNRIDGQYAAAPQIALASGGRLVAAWHEGPSTPYRSYASLLDAGTWGALSGPNDGLLLVSTRAVAPFLVLDASNVPVVLHGEVAGSPGTRQIFVRRYNAVSLP